MPTTHMLTSCVLDQKSFALVFMMLRSYSSTKPFLHQDIIAHYHTLNTYMSPLYHLCANPYCFSFLCRSLPSHNLLNYLLNPLFSIPQRHKIINHAPRTLFATPHEVLHFDFCWQAEFRMWITEIVSITEQFQPLAAINLKEGISNIVFRLDVSPVTLAATSAVSVVVPLLASVSTGLRHLP